MPTLESYYARFPMTPQTFPRAPARQLAYTGAEKEGEALAGIGRGLGQISGLLADIEADKQLYRDRVTLAEMEDSLSDFEYTAGIGLRSAKYAEVEDFKKAETKYKSDWNKTVRGLVKNKNQRVSDQFKLHTTQRWDRAKRNYHGQVWEKERSWGRATAKTLYNKKLRKSDLQGALAALDAHQQYFTTEEIGAMKEKAPHDVEWYAGIHLANNNPDLLLEIVDDPEYFDNLDKVEIERLKSYAESSRNARKIKDDKEQKQLEGQVRKQLTKEMLDGTLTEQRLDQLRESASPVDYQHFAEYLLGRKAKTEQKLSESEETRKRWDIIRNLPEMIRGVRENRTNPIDVMNQLDELATLGDKGKSDAEQYLLKLNEAVEAETKPDDPLKRPTVKRGFKVFDELKQEHLWLSEEAREEGYTPEDERLNILKWQEISNDFEKWLLEKDRTDEEIEKKVQSLTEPIKEEIKLNWFEKLMWSKGRRQLFGLVGTEQERLVKKLGEPMTQTEFERTVGTIEDDMTAQLYYKKWSGKWR